MSGPKTANEAAFDQCVRAIGGTCLDDVLTSDSKAPENADYFFESENVIAELKRLAKDPMADPAIKEKIQGLYNSWVRAGLVMPRKEPGKLTLNTRDLPRSCAIELLGVLKKQLDEAYVKKSNNQIKSTKKLLNRPDAKGLLLLMNEGNFSYEPSVIFNLLFHIFNGKSRSAINQVVVFTSEFISILPVNERGGFYWAQPSLGDRADVPAGLLKRLCHQWGIVLRTKHPEVTESWIISGPTPDWMDKVKHAHRSV